MSVALSVFKLSVQTVHQLQQPKIEVSFEQGCLISELLHVANHSILKQGSLQLGAVGWFWLIAS